MRRIGQAVAPNLQMLQHVVEGLEPIAPALEHISLMQGYKVYGAHLGRLKHRRVKATPGICRRSLTWRNSGIWCSVRPANVGIGAPFARAWWGLLSAIR